MKETGKELIGYEAPGQLETIRELEDRFAIAVRQRELLATYISQRMQPGKHFYKVADGQKPSLTKEGGELICLPHGYKPMYFLEGGPLQPGDDDIPYQLIVKCRLMKGEMFAGEGMGSASSHITLKDGTRVVRQKDIGLRHNATLKMAQKSAYIASTLNATAASEFFTQDMDEPGASGDSSVQKETPMGLCPVHKVPFVERTGPRGKFWACPERPGGQFCKERPQIVEGQKADNPQDPSPKPPVSEPKLETVPMPVITNWGDFFTWATKKRDQGGLGYVTRDAVAKALSFDTADALYKSQKALPECVAELLKLATRPVRSRAETGERAEVGKGE